MVFHARTGAAYKQQNLLKEQKQIRRHLEQEIDNFNLEVNKQRKMIESLEKERDRYISESRELTQKVRDALYEVKLKQMAIFGYKKKLAEADTEFQRQTKLFEAVQSDRNTFRKLLVEAQAEISELKEELNNMRHQNEQYCKNIKTMETQLMNEDNALQKNEKERENLEIEIRKLTDELHDSKEQITALKLEEKKLHKVIQDADEEREKQKKEMKRIMNERHILGTQIGRKNDELSLLNEKIKSLQSTLHKGEAQYDQRLEDIRLLKLEIMKLRQEKTMLPGNVTNMTDMRQEIFHLERDVAREKLKCRALEEAAQRPLNMHRWRLLQGSDPATYELIQKIQLLQKRVLEQSEKTVKLEAQLQESESLCRKLRELLARQPDPGEAAIRLQETQCLLRNKDKKMKCLVDELNMYKAQVSEYKSDLEKVNKELRDVKEKYFAQKRHVQKMKK